MKNKVIEAKHSYIEAELDLNSDHHSCVTIIDGEVFVDVAVKGFNEKIRMVAELEEVIKQIENS